MSIWEHAMCIEIYRMAIIEKISRKSRQKNTAVLPSLHSFSAEIGRLTKAHFAIGSVVYDLGCSRSSSKD